MRIYKLRQYRRFKDYRQIEMAKILQISEQTYIKAEKNPDRLTLGQMRLIEKTLQVSHDEIYSEGGENND